MYGAAFVHATTGSLGRFQYGDSRYRDGTRPLQHTGAAEGCHVSSLLLQYPFAVHVHPAR